MNTGLDLIAGVGIGGSLNRKWRSLPIDRLQALASSSGGQPYIPVYKAPGQYTMVKVNASGEVPLPGFRRVTKREDDARLGGVDYWNDNAGAVLTTAGWVDNGDGSFTATNASTPVYIPGATRFYSGEQVVFDVAVETIAGSVQIEVGDTGTGILGGITMDSVNTLVVALTGINKPLVRGQAFTGTIRVKSVRKYVPTYLDTAEDGTPLHPWTYVKGQKEYILHEARVDGEVIGAGEYRHWGGYYYIPLVTGTTGTSGHPDSPGIGGQVVDGTVTWQCEGLYNPHIGMLGWGSITNKCTCYSVPNEPVGTQSYHNGTTFVQNINGMTLSGDVNATLTIVDGLDVTQVKHPDGTLVDYSVMNPSGKGYRKTTGTAAAYAKPDGLTTPDVANMLSVVQKVTGTIVSTNMASTTSPWTGVAGTNHWSLLPLTGLPGIGGAGNGIQIICRANQTVDFFLPTLIESGNLPPYALPTAGTAYTLAARSTSVPSAGLVRANNWGVDLTVLPHKTAPASIAILSLYSDANTSLLLGTDASGHPTLTQTSSGVATTVTVSGITLQKDVPVQIQIFKSTSQIGITASEYEGVWEPWTVASQSTPLSVPASFGLGNSNSASQGMVSLLNIKTVYAGDAESTIEEDTDEDLFSIGSTGGAGFGVGICPTASLPDGFEPLDGCNVRTSDNYGTYQYSDGSIMAWVPKFWYKVGTGSNGLDVNVIDIQGTSRFSSTAQANAAGYALHRAFVDGGVEHPGFFVDKYLASNNGGVASSIKNGLPLSTHGDHNPIADLTACSGNAYYEAIDAAKGRGDRFFCCSRFIWSALALLSMAHGQAAANGQYCGWYDATNNFPKGCNNNALGDTNDASVAYQSDGYSNCGKTGSGTPFAKTTHNGQACGVADVNGLMYEIQTGMTCIATSKSITAATQTNPCKLTIPGHGGATGAQMMITGVGGMVSLNDRIYTVTVVDADNVTLDGVDATGYNAFTSGGSATFGTFYAAKEATAMRNFTAGNSAATDHWGAVGCAAMMTPVAVPLATAAAASNGLVQRWGNAAAQVLDEATTGAGRLLTGLGLPKAGGVSTSGTTLFGTDYFYQYIRNEMCLISSLNWGNGSNAGVWGLYLSSYRAHSSSYVGFRAACYPD